MEHAITARNRFAHGARQAAWFVLMLVATGLVVAICARVTDFALGSPLWRWNAQVTLALHAHAHPMLDVLAVGLTRLGRNTATFAVVTAAVVLLLRMRRRDDAVLLVVSVLGSVALTTALKAAFHEARPQLFVPIEPERSYGFPSGHASTAVALYGYFIALVLEVRRWGRARWAACGVLGVFAIAIMWSRVYLGVHWLTDVVGGAMLGGAWLGVCLTRRRRAWAVEGTSLGRGTQW